MRKLTRRVIGSIYGLHYLYDCGWIGGLLVHKDLRKMGIGRKLLEAALGFLGPRNAFLFVEPRNVAAKRLFESLGFRSAYQRLNYIVETPLPRFRSTDNRVTYGVEWSDVNEAIRFRERCGVANIGYYPIKVARKAFEHLKRRRKILRVGNLLAIIENSFRVSANRNEFTFSEYLLNGMSAVIVKKSIVEVNPFYIERELSDFAELINCLIGQGEVNVWTYEKDSVLAELSLKGTLGATVMELGKSKLCVC